MKFRINENNFCLNAKKVFLNAGEIHYFRIKRELWDKHLDAAKEAGLTTVTSYVPWACTNPWKAFLILTAPPARNVISKAGCSDARPGD